MRGRPWSWITGRPRLVDGLLVGITLLPGVIGPFADYFRHEPAFLVGLSIGLVPLQSIPLWWRRSHPVAVWRTVVSVAALKALTGLSFNASAAAVVFAIYALSVYGPQVERLWVAGVSIALIVADVINAYFKVEVPLGDLFKLGPPMLVAWVIGDYIRSRRQFFLEMVARHRQEREQAAEEERLRIARELHDVVAHNVSVMAIQAGAARVSGNATNETLAQIEKGARDTLAELNNLLGVLRKSPTAPDLAPQPSLDDVDALLKPAREAGLEATLKVTGEKRSLSAALDLSAYRIVQEAVTNVLKHANASRLEVVIGYEHEGIALTISDNGNGPGEGLSTGHGVIGMRERVALFGGKMGTGSTPLGGFTVHARLPYKN